MKPAVKSFAELPALMNHRTEPKMGYPRKKTPAMMDRVVQIIWHFKHLHGETETPSTSLIGNELGITPSGVGPYITKLEEQGRVDRIQMRPMRVTLLDHPMNKRAIKLYQRELEKAHKPLDMPKPKPAEADARREADAEVIKELVEGPSPTAAPMPEPSPTTERRRTFVPLRDMNWAEANSIIAAHGGNLDAIARSFILNTARPGELLEQLLDRGYTVHKTNPRWKD